MCCAMRCAESDKKGTWPLRSHLSSTMAALSRWVAAAGTAFVGVYAYTQLPTADQRVHAANSLASGGFALSLMPPSVPALHYSGIMQESDPVRKAGLSAGAERGMWERAVRASIGPV